MWQKISNIASILGILGVSANSYWGNKYEVHIALGFVVVTCLVVGAFAVRALLKWQSATFPRGYIPIATFVRYSTTDGKQVTHETFRQIQVKHAFLTKIPHRYRWSGTKPPKLSSSLQQIGTPGSDAASGFDVVEVRFQHPRYYNDTEIVHIRSVMDDTDEQSETQCSLLIENPIKVVQFRIELLHCQKPSFSGMKAHVERRLQTVRSGQFEPIESVPFDINTRSFEYLLASPEPGFEYRIRWDRPTPTQPRSRRRP